MQTESAPRPDEGARLLTALVVLGIVLRLWAYLSHPSLWLDELLLSRAIMETPLSRLLTEPLPLDQVAPRGFLLAQFAAVKLFGTSEFALRLVPLLVAIAGILLFRRLAERMLTGYAVPYAVATFAIAVPLMRYAAEAKQYGLDATATTLLLLLALDLRERDLPTRRLVFIGLGGFLVVAFSQASVLVMSAVGLTLLIEWATTRERRLVRALTLTIPIWASACLAGVVAGYRSMTPSTKEFMQRFWDTGFMPLPLRSMRDLEWFWSQTLSLFDDAYLLRYPLGTLYLLVAALGCWVLWRRRRDLALLLVCPFLLALAAAVAQQYPFRSRLLLFLMPVTLLAVAAGIEWLRSSLARTHHAIGAVAMLLLFVSPLRALAGARPPYELEHHRTLLSELQARRQPGDAVLAFPLSRIGLLYYGPQYGLARGDWRTLLCDRYETRAYVLDADRYRGTPRLWLLSSNARPMRSARQAVRDYFSTIGTRRDSISYPSASLGDVSLELYDLSDPLRLSSADAATFPVTPLTTDPPPSCRPWTMDSYEGTPR